MEDTLRGSNSFCGGGVYAGSLLFDLTQRPHIMWMVFCHDRVMDICFWKIVEEESEVRCLESDLIDRGKRRSHNV